MSVDPTTTWPTVELLSTARTPDDQIVTAAVVDSKPAVRSTYPADLQRLLQSEILAQAAQQPNAIALLCGEQAISYGELVTQAQQVAQALSCYQLSPDTTVAVCSTDPLEMTAAILGVLIAGAAYVPLDASYPGERIAGMLADAGTKLVLASSEICERFLPGERTVLDISQLLSKAHSVLFTDQTSATGPADLAYVIFTSGSTGRPKGVMIEHAMALNTIDDINQRFQVQATDRVLAISSFSFDLSVYDLFGILGVGGAIVFPTTEQRRDPAAWLQLIERHRITIWNSVPALFEMFTSWAEVVGPAVREQTKTLRLVMLSGDWIPVTLPDRWRRLQPATALHSLGGATEGSIWSIAYAIQKVDPSWKSIPYGRALTNQTMRVLDKDLQPCPTGEIGEICIGGRGVARGYIGRPELTAERFVPDPFSQLLNARLYRTGDQGRMLPDGQIEFLGRADQQVKVNGYRIELGEIEAVLRTIPSLSEVVVVMRRDRGSPCLVAYAQVLAGQCIDRAYIAQQLKLRLPEYMLPAALTVVTEWPLTANGKLDRSALPVPDWQADQLSSQIPTDLPPAASINSAAIVPSLQLIWQTVLESKFELPTDRSFLQLGGDSLRAVDLVLQVARQLGVTLPPTWPLSQQATLNQMALELSSQKQHQVSHLLPDELLLADRQQPLLLSYPQQQLWLSDQLAGESAVYSVPFALEINGELNTQQLQLALDRIVARQEILRTTFHATSTGQTQQIHAQVQLRIELHDYSLQEVTAAKTQAWQQIKHDATLRFDLTRAPLLRVKLYQVAEQQWLLYLNVHHLIVDGWTLGLLGQDLVAEYQALVEGQQDQVARPRQQYVDYANWQRQIARFDSDPALASYWRTQFQGFREQLELPTDRPRPEYVSYEGATHYFELVQPLVEQLQTLARKRGVSLFSLLLASWQLLLARHSGQSDLCVGTPSSGRSHSAWHDLWGYLIQVIALRSKLDPALSFVEYLDQVAHTVTTGLAHQDYPLVALIKDVQTARLPKKHPLFPVLMVLEEDPANCWQLPGCQVRPLNLDNGTSKFEMLLALMTTDSVIRGSWEYRTDLFDQIRIQSMCKQWQTLLQAIVAQPQLTLGALEFQAVPEQAIGRRLDEHNTPCNIMEMFHVQAKQTSAAIAVQVGTRQWTYAELQSAAMNLATQLQAQGLGPGSLVGVATGRSYEMLVAVLGILQAGAAYVPLDLTLPAERLKLICSDANLALILCDAAGQTLDWSQITDCQMQFVAANSAVTPLNPWPSPATTDDAAYVLYTSGSTGRPKGVVMPQRALVNLIRWQLTQSQAGNPGRTLQYASLGFDVSFQELFATWGAGGTVVMIDEDLRSDFPALATFVAEQSIDRLYLPFVALQHFCEAANQRQLKMPALREVITAGEQLKITPTIQQFFQSVPNCRLWNHYGPTECHVVTAKQMPVDVSSWPALPPIGRPIDQTWAIVLDQWQGIAPPGVPGELYLGGECVASGYLAQPTLTDERFVTLNLAGHGPVRCYRTGDYCRWNWQGELEFLGRRDDQLKIRGYRVELGEVEAALRTLPGLQAAAVTARQDRGDQKYLVAYLVWISPVNAMDAVQIRRHLELVLPAYMIPSSFVNLPALPVNANGKVDRAALPAPAHTTTVASTQIRNYTETRMVRIWRKLFHQPNLGPVENFFDLGGESLLAARLFQQIEQEFQVTLSLTELLHRPTPRQMSELIDSRQSVVAGWDSLVPIQEQGDLQPLFLLPGIGGNLVDFYPLARMMGNERPIFGLQPKGLDGQDRPLTSVAEIAAAYLLDLRRVQPAGPYFLAGYSLGGVIAFEIAQQLRAAGETVALLALLDSSFFEQTVEPPFWKRLGFHLRYLWSGEAEKTWSYLTRRLKNLWFWVQHGCRGRTADYLLDSLELSPASRRVAQVHYEAWTQYQPQPYPGPVEVLLATWKPGAEQQAGASWPWAHLIDQGLTIATISSTHDNLFKGRNLVLIAEQLQVMLQRAQASIELN